MSHRPGHAPAFPSATRAWVLTDGKAGDEEPCLAVVEALGLAVDVQRIRPRAVFAACGIVDPRVTKTWRDARRAQSLPDLVVASGRRAVPYLHALKRLSGGRTFTVFLKDPRRGSGTADLIWVPEHDRLRGHNVVVTLLGPHRVSAERLRAWRDHPDPRLPGPGRPRVGVLVGGNSRHHRFTDDDGVRLLAQLTQVARSGAALMVTPSRRTPRRLAEGLRTLASHTGSFFWDGSGDNPYVAILAAADYIVVTADSANMLGEAAATGRPILTFSPSGGHPKLDRLLGRLGEKRITRPFAGSLEGDAYPPLDETPLIAEAIASDFARHRAAFRSA